MSQRTCETCGGTELLKEDGVFVCRSCGGKCSVEKEIEGTVIINGRRCKINDFDEIIKALKFNGNKIQAIQPVRAMTGLSLPESKQFVDELIFNNYDVSKTAGDFTIKATESTQMLNNELEKYEEVKEQSNTCAKIGAMTGGLIGFIAGLILGSVILGISEDGLVVLLIAFFSLLLGLIIGGIIGDTIDNKIYERNIEKIRKNRN